jgi:nucleotide-binding universal stress UspA family protein
MFKPKTILVPIDFSETSEKAFQDALDIAVQNDAMIYLLHVNEVIQLCAVDYCLDAALVEQIENKTLASSTEMLQKIINKFPNTKGIKIQSIVAKGNPFEEILKVQNDKKIDLIVIAPHGKKGIFGHLLGSVAEKIARGANCQVLIVKN